jgi:prepilin-type N-terminal cleavage/methylation domain-containing protein
MGLAGPPRISSETPCSRPGFSLIELVVVLVLMAVMASLATLSVRGVLARQRLARAAEVVEQFDTALRRSARNQRRVVTGMIDRSRSRLIIGQPDDPARAFRLPGHVAILSVRYRTQSTPAGRSRILALGDGSSPSYAVGLASGGARRWVLFAGGTGQVVHGLDAASIDSLLGTK